MCRLIKVCISSFINLQYSLKSTSGITIITLFFRVRTSWICTEFPCRFSPYLRFFQNSKLDNKEYYTRRLKLTHSQCRKECERSDEQEKRNTKNAITLQGSHSVEMWTSAFLRLLFCSCRLLSSIYNHIPCYTLHLIRNACWPMLNTFRKYF